MDIFLVDSIWRASFHTTGPHFQVARRLLNLHRTKLWKIASVQKATKCLCETKRELSVLTNETEIFRKLGQCTHPKCVMLLFFLSSAIFMCNFIIIPETDSDYR